MRARYSAYVRGRLDYVHDTWHPATRPAALTAHDPSTRWLGLEVRAHEQQDDRHATVTFVARSRVAGRGVRLHETSRFVHEQGCWWYVDGDLH
jgi:SEC-C motif-containing protein